MAGTARAGARPVVAQVEVPLAGPHLLAASLAVSCCAAPAACGTDRLGPLEAHRVPLGPDMDALARRLRRIRDLEPGCGARPWPALRLVGGPGSSGPAHRVVATFTPREVALLTVAAQRLHALLALGPAWLDDEDFLAAACPALAELLTVLSGSG